MGFDPDTVITASPLLSAEPYGEATPLVQRFMVRLSRLPLDVWGQAAEGVSLVPGGRESDAPELRLARARLRYLLAAMPSELARVKRRIDDMTAVACGFTGRATIAAMRRVALTAALALLVRPRLADEDFAELYAPFALIIPVEELTAGF
ncbi:MAG TPA: hypothetical protein VMM18_12285 [Gemmatimonadaceae bacterium]|nr:hypothetical protein [Gemmatimonadaceae bacterium]